MNFLGDIGGVFPIFCWVLGIFILPISYHDFMTKAFQKMYLANTKNSSMFKHSIEKVEP